MLSHIALLRAYITVQYTRYCTLVELYMLRCAILLYIEGSTKHVNSINLEVKDL